MTAFVRAARRLKIRPVIHVADSNPWAPAACVADRAHGLPSVNSLEYVPALLKIVRKQKIDLLIPLIDSELTQIANRRDAFASAGCCAVISSPEVVGICRDKLLTYAFLRGQGIDTPKTWKAQDVLGRMHHRFPYFLKPRSGSAGAGGHKISGPDDLRAMAPYLGDGIIQEFIDGVEYTLDVYTGFDGVPRCVVPRERMEVRGGEVVQARTCKRDAIIKAGLRVVEALKACRGVITLQLFLERSGRIVVIEINPRFGGGVPLAIEAGADFPRWLLAEWLGRRLRIRVDQFRDRLVMMRYHQSFFSVDRSPGGNRRRSR